MEWCQAVWERERATQAGDTARAKAQGQEPTGPVMIQWSHCLTVVEGLDRETFQQPRQKQVRLAGQVIEFRLCHVGNGELLVSSEQERNRG